MESLNPQFNLRLLICSTGLYAHTYAKHVCNPHSTVGPIHYLCSVPRNHINFKLPRALVTRFRGTIEALAMLPIAYPYSVP